MGFWDSLWEGIKDGAKFVLDTTGDIAEAAGTIAKVAGVFFVNEDEINVIAQSDPVLKVFDDYEKATTVLEKRAHSLCMQQPDPPGMVAMQNPVSTEGKLSGIWTNPVAVTEAGLNGAKNIDTYQDLSKFLTVLGAPSAIVTPDLQICDTAELVAQSLFANAPNGANSEKQGNDADPVEAVSTAIQDRGGDNLIKASHVYYEVPMGVSAPETVWHGGLHVNVQRSRSDCEAYIARRGEPTYLSEQHRTPATTGVVWQVTLNIEWADRVAAEDGAKKTRDLIINSGSGYSIIANTPTGKTQIIILKAPAGKTPADARVFMTDIVRKALAAEKKTSAAAGRETAMPQILVKSTVLA
ncbi:hypothetical protein P170DRAFT_465333 [Aspergillus steynii IBT 23096]|uniref:Uncharacterized protein n=1 Tax=Aspergillus steynii IBT 23096 TaxID=1392250 RepID=A0A2I2G4G4_9EURO|nr:uncharacterized protein P170DRAFT_465333 [Aspergillus steynii IBT 23096]PLB47758.1 hypothetical protein P170DRAFT_465333 [Aspergillus steynii IBT 23096]